MSVTGLPYTATLHRFTQHNHRFTKHKFFISLKAFLELKKILDWDTSKSCYKDIAKYPWALAWTSTKSRAHRQARLGENKRIDKYKVR